MLRSSLVAICMCFSFCAMAQGGVKPPAEYTEAAKIVKDALVQFQLGDVNNAEELIIKALNIYPTENYLDYVDVVFRLSDNQKATQLIDLFYDRIKSFPGGKIVIYDLLLDKFVEISVPRALVHYGEAIYNVSRNYATSSWIIQFLEKVTKNEILNKDPEYDVEEETRKILAIDLAVLSGRTDVAVNLAKKQDVPAYYLAEIYILTGDYQKAIAEADKLQGSDSFYITRFKLVSYLMLGDKRADIYYKEYNDQREAYFKLSGKRFGKLNIIYYALAINDLHKKNFQSALKNLDSALNYQQPDTRVKSMVNRWSIFKSIGDAYLGLQQYDKARDNYNISLLANPKYDQAVVALNNLKNVIAKQIATDKTPPSIKITEPSVKRGLQVTVGTTDVLVRGIATDPSGLKSVSINGKQVYTQSAGDFWGNIELNDGSNKIIIQATDVAGNVSKQTFIIDKTAPDQTETDIIVPVSENEGKNYCVLIAAQNYKDASIPSLQNPIQDAMKLKIVLKNNYGFSDENIITLFNPGANDIKRQLLELNNLIQPEDNIVIFYAGHGIWVEKEKKGYWLMTDARRNDPNTWVSNKDILNLISKLPSRHTLLITDACFSGGVFKTRSIGKDASASIKLIDEKISRVAITSGNDTEVPDESVFMRYLVKALNENKEKYLTAQKMFITHIMEAVMTETKTEPRYGTLELAGHVGGDFIFVKK